MKILLVEDDAPIAMGIEYALKKENHTVVVAKNLMEGKKLFDNKVELILLDVMLPDGNGYDFCKEIRKWSEIPIIFMTALDEEANIVFGLDIGGDDYISKPIRISELLSRINAVMRRQKSSNNYLISNKILCGNVTIEPLKCRVTVLSEEIYLTAAEYKLLLMLAENKDKALNRSSIIEKLWDIDGDFVDYNTLNVYMKRLREKLGPEAEKHIVTVRGIGYMWKDEVNKV